jgi:hypothetical protein
MVKKQVADKITFTCVTPPNQDDDRTFILIWLKANQTHIKLIKGQFTHVMSPGKKMQYYQRGNELGKHILYVQDD